MDIPDTERLFLALPLPEAVRSTLAAAAEPLPGVNWTRPEQLHLTLRFVGNLEPRQADAMREHLRAVRVAPFLLPIEGLGAFPPNRPPNVLWIGVGTGHPRLFQLRQRIDDAVLAAGVPLDVRTFHPHVTLARVTADGAKPIAHWMHARREFAAPPFRVEAFELFASELRPGGAVHTLKERFPLTG